MPRHEEFVSAKTFCTSCRSTRHSREIVRPNTLNPNVPSLPNILFPRYPDLGPFEVESRVHPAAARAIDGSGCASVQNHPRRRVVLPQHFLSRCMGGYTQRDLNFSPAFWKCLGVVHVGVHAAICLGGKQTRNECRVDVMVVNIV